MTGEDAQLHLSRLVEALRILSLPAVDQIHYLRRLGVGGLADELALQFDDCYRLVPQLVACGVISPATASLLQSLDKELTSMSDASPDVWSDNGLQTDPRWDSVRKRSAHLIRLVDSEAAT